MVARRFWRRIDLRWVNLLLLAACGLTVAVWHHELRWAAAELPGYFVAEIGSPDERHLYLRAKRLIESHGDLDRARALLERSIAIDPNSDAVYWLAECLRAEGDDAGALRQYLAYLDFDPTRLEAWLEAAALLRRRGEPQRARELLERGLRHFEDTGPLLEPRLDPDVGLKYNRKAIDLYGYYGQAAERLRQELAAAAPAEATR